MRITVFALSSIAAALLSPAAETTVPVDGVRVGFTLGLGEWRPAKKAKSSGGTGSERAFVPTVSVPHGQMKSLSVSTNGNVVTAMWKGHPLCGDSRTDVEGIASNLCCQELSRLEINKEGPLSRLRHICSPSPAHRKAHVP